MRIKFKIFVLMLFLVLIISGIYIYHSFINQRDLTLKAIDEKLYTAALMAQATLPVDYHDAIRDANSVSKEGYEQIVDRFNNLCVDLGLDYLWSVIQIDNKIYFTSSTSPDKSIINQKHAKFFELHRDPMAFQGALKTMKPHFSSFHNEWGHGRMVLVPQRDSLGRLFMFGASMKLSAVDVVLRTIIWDATIVALIFLVIGFMFSYIFANLLSKPFNDLVDNIEDIASGNFNKKIEENGFYEKVALARSFNRMSLVIKEKISALLESEGKYRRLTENAKDMIYRMSLPGGKYEYVSPVSLDLFGYTPKEFYKSPLLIQEAIHPEWRDYFKKEWEKLLSGDMPPYYEYQIVAKNGECKWLHQRNVLIRDDEGTPIAIEGIVTDITERKNAEEELLKAKEKAEYVNEAKTEFLMNVSHDIRTPMNVINGFTDLLLKTQMRDEQKKYCKMIKRKGEDLIHLIEGIIDISAVEKGKIRMHYSPLSVSALVEDVRDSIDVQIGDKKIKFICSVSKDVPQMILGDSMRLKQILENLCGNAVKYTDKGKIRLIVSAENKNLKDNTCVIKFSVEDTGIGISEDKIAHIFEPYTRYYQLGRGQEREGVGMGLHIVETLLKEMGSEISVETEVGRGSKFSFEIKMKLALAQEEGKEDYSQDKPSKEVDLAGKNILIAEDDEATKELMKRLLVETKCNIFFASDGDEVLDEMNKRKYDVVLMDLRMPKMDGFETTKMIRKQIDNNVPILALTAHVADFVEGKCKKAGMNGYISKPINIDKLKRLIEEYC